MPPLHGRVWGRNATPLPNTSRVFGEWQGTLEIQEYLDGIFRMLQIDPSTYLLQQPEIDEILCLGEARTMWTRSHHFPPTGDTTHAANPTCCGP